MIEKVYHTYRDDFPLMSNMRMPIEFDDRCEGMIRTLILDLSELLPLPDYRYISRHAQDKVPYDQLQPFFDRHAEFVSGLGNDQPYNIPTVWFVGFFKETAKIIEVEEMLASKSIRYFVETSERQGLHEVNHPYWDEKKDAELFIEFIGQLTNIGIDLLKTPPSIMKLRELCCLEWLLYRSIDKMDADLVEMKEFLIDNSDFYRTEIEADLALSDLFWINFRKIKMQPNDDGSGADLGTSIGLLV